ncbi:thiosulfate oxidation carrier complex protein SoxZ [Magnetovirga frankeli]|uniref:thiosulfate oxidation carrier complex protein SoxZ n=1 Tax=Magnetovirga frankeli TaxID=947516 RepID=UPI001293972C|nr:thiosulfate oxidation carrier complex protein SoxZ [gamma proteobacterium SS-5]
MANSMKIRAKSKNGVANIKVLITHPMEGGGRKDSKTGEPIPAHFIQEVVFDINGSTAMTANLSGGVSKNPYLNVKAAANPGDKLKVSWVDNKGESDSIEADIK